MTEEATKFYRRPNQRNLLKRLKDLYVNLYISTGMTQSEAEKLVEKLVPIAIQLSVEANTYNLPPNFGDIILGDATAGTEDVERFAESIRQESDYLKSEGVSEDDIRYYWNLNELERRMAQVDDNNHRIALFLSERESGKTVEQASAIVRENFPIYGYPSDKNQPKGEDRHLPIELKDRVNRYIERRMLDISSYKKDIKGATSFNALIRKEIKAGNLY